MPINVRCGCGKALRAPDAAAGKAARCPGCGGAVRIPSARVAPAQPGSECPACHIFLPAGAVLCTNCGTNLRTGRKLEMKTHPESDGPPRTIFPLFWDVILHPFGGMERALTLLGQPGLLIQTMVFFVLAVGLASTFAGWSGGAEAFWRQALGILSEVVVFSISVNLVARLFGNGSNFLGVTVAIVFAKSVTIALLALFLLVSVLGFGGAGMIWIGLAFFVWAVILSLSVISAAYGMELKGAFLTALLAGVISRSAGLYLSALLS